MSSNDNLKIIFAKATVKNFCAIVVNKIGGNLIVSDVVNSESITEFVTDISILAMKHSPFLVQFECSVYLNESAILKKKLICENIAVRAYKSEGHYFERIVSQAEWINENVLVNDKFTGFIDLMTSFSTTDSEKNNIAMDVLSDATIFFRRNYFR